ncbi:hypothetical protein HUU61_19635 [Rhodopseudomonas palustris]|nr:hypothetical protein [Rhodopseudomonas palustris]
MRQTVILWQVMLRLRARYVSKAAIFKVAGYDRTGRKSKSSLNSKGLNRGRRGLATVFSLAI